MTNTTSIRSDDMSTAHEKRTRCRIMLPKEYKGSVILSGRQGSAIQFAERVMQGENVHLRRDEKGWTLRVVESKLGVCVNGVNIGVGSDIPLTTLDFLWVGRWVFCMMDDALICELDGNVRVNGLSVQADPDQTSALQFPIFIRSTRVRQQVEPSEIEVLPPKPEQMERDEGLLLTVLPALSMIVLVVVVRGLLGSGGSFVLYTVGSMLLSLGTAVFAYRRRKKDHTRIAQQRRDNYQAYLKDKVEQIMALREREARIRHYIYRPIEDNLEIVQNFERGLFDRIPGDEDFLDVRIGQGKVPAIVTIKTNVQEYRETQDELMDLPETIAHEYRNIHNAPIVVKLGRMSALGVVGVKRFQMELMKIIALDLVVRQYFKELKLFFVFDESDKDAFMWTRWLRNCQDEDTTLRNLIFDDESAKVHMEHLYRILAAREEQVGNNEEKSFLWPCYYVLFVLDCDRIRSHPISQFVEHAQRYGVCFIFFDEHEERVPRGCGQIVRLDSQQPYGVVVDCANGERVTRFDYPIIKDADVQSTSHKLSPVWVEEASLENEITKSITLFGLLGISDVAELDLSARWRDARIDKSMAAPLGVRAKNDKVYLDLHERFHGPHGLVAGTTGSGKSEILQSYVLSMAVHFSPLEVGFLFIDFKGGGMAKQFEQLPHYLGAITNIDGREILRSLKSIRAELLRRQSLFAQYKINSIGGYIELYKTGKQSDMPPLPHLIIIVDEFAELKSEQPDFMKELISAARIGRSLGVHLILATQKPTGVVDDQIWSNSKFKLCLKVQTREDSKEVLKTPLAAEIREPGRAYLQVGNNEILELFQSAYSGAYLHDGSDDEQFDIQELNMWGKPTTVFASADANRGAHPTDQASREKITELQAIVQWVRTHCQRANIEKLPDICMAPLPDKLQLAQLPKVSASDKYGIVATIGLFDDPEMQLQAPLCLDLSQSNTFVLGSAQSGKTVLLETMLMSLAQRYTPKQLGVYIIDGGNSIPKSFEQSAIVGGICYREEEDRITNLLSMLRKELDKRRQAFADANVGSFKAYLEAGYSEFPHLLLMLDTAVVFKDYNEALFEQATQMSREGISCGLYTVVTSTQYSVLNSRIMLGFGTRVALNCNDAGEYSNLFDRCRMEPKDTPGRGLFMQEKRILEFQTAWHAEGALERERNERAAEAFSALNVGYEGARTRPIPVVPELLNASQFDIQLGIKQPYIVPIGMSYNSLEAVTINLLEQGMLPIIGRERSGRTNFVLHVLCYIQKTTLLNLTQAYIVDGSQQPLEYCKQEFGFVERYSTDPMAALDYLSEIVDQLEERQTYLAEHRQEGAEHVLLKRFPLLLLVIEHADAVEQLSKEKEFIELLARFQKLMRYKAMILVDNVENISYTGMSAPLFGKKLLERQSAIIMEDIGSIHSFGMLTKAAKLYPKPLRIGDAYIFVKGEVADKIRTVYTDSEYYIGR